MNGSRPVTVFIVDDHDVVRAGLAAILAREADIRVVGEAPSGERALEALDACDPDVVLLDQRLPGMAGTEVCRAIAGRGLRARVVLLSAYADEATIGTAQDAGASAFVVKDVDSRELKRVIRATAGGEATIVRNSSRGRGLAPRHRGVLALLVQGCSNREIADALDLSLDTVKTYVGECYEALGVTNRAAATAAAIRRGVV